jgi:hypothetical protein
MALVYHDQVKEAGRELAKQLLPFPGSGDRLVEAEINLEGGVDAAPSVNCCGEADGAAVVAFDGLGPYAALSERRTARPSSRRL